MRRRGGGFGLKKNFCEFIFQTQKSYICINVFRTHQCNFQVCTFLEFASTLNLTIMLLAMTYFAIISLQVCARWYTCMREALEFFHECDANAFISHLIWAPGLQSHKISSQSCGSKNSENRVNFIAKSSVACLLRSSFNSYSSRCTTGNKLQRQNKTTRSLYTTQPLAIEKINSFTFFRSGECFIFEGDLRVGKWGEKARGECAAGLFPSSSSHSTPCSQGAHTQTEAKW